MQRYDGQYDHRYARYYQQQTLLRHECQQYPRGTLPSQAHDFTVRVRDSLTRSESRRHG